MGTDQCRLVILIGCQKKFYAESTKPPITPKNGPRAVALAFNVVMVMVLVRPRIL
jgi:hypothetical protein